jgi:hypothetical protein
MKLRDSVIVNVCLLEVVLFEVVLFGVEPPLTVPVTAVFVAGLADFALSASIFPPSRLQDANTSRARKIKPSADHRRMHCFPSSQIVVIGYCNIIVFVTF